MKKIVSLLLLTVFLFSTIGVIASSYQCKKPAAINKSCCQAPDKNCCEKNSRLLKITDHFISASLQLPSKSAHNYFLAIVAVSQRAAMPGHINLFAGQAVHAPPDPAVDICVLVQSFRI